MNSPYADPRVTLAWSTPRPLPATEAPRRWLGLCLALAHWSGPALAVERRLVVPGGGPLVSEAILVSIDGADILAPKGRLRFDASQFVLPFLRGRDAQPLATSSALRAAGFAHDRNDVAEASVTSVRSDVAVDALAATLAALADGCSAATLSLVLASPTPLWRRGGGGLDPLRCTLRLASADQLPAAALAHASVLGGLSSDGLRRPNRDAMAAPKTAAMTADEFEERCSPSVAAVLLALPISPAACDAERRGHLLWPDRRVPVAFIGAQNERARLLMRLISTDLRAGRRVGVVDAVGMLTAALGNSRDSTGGLRVVRTRARSAAGARALRDAADSPPGSCVVVDGVGRFVPKDVHNLLRLCDERQIALTLAGDDIALALRNRCDTVVNVRND